MIGNVLSTDIKPISSWAFRFCNDENCPLSYEKINKSTHSEEYFTKQSDLKHQEKNSCFKSRQDHDMKRKMIQSCEKKTTISNNCQLNDLTMKLDEVNTTKKKLKNKLKHFKKETRSSDKFCDSNSFEETEKFAYREYKDLKRTTKLLEILINKKLTSVI